MGEAEVNTTENKTTDVNAQDANEQTIPSEASRMKMASDDREERFLKLEELFDVLDQDNSGGIDVEELGMLGVILSEGQDLPTREETLYVC